MSYINLPRAQTLQLWLDKNRLGTQRQINREGPRSFHRRNGTIVAAILGGVHYMYLYTSFDLVHRWSTKLVRINSEATQSFFSIFTGSQAISGTVSFYFF